MLLCWLFLIYKVLFMGVYGGIVDVVVVDVGCGMYWFIM